ncbi:MAG: hypothetical protein HY787_01540 [Deltaproteobacteria bacterium]|nr:hypothetical protein [Deltaproteobacteria bacterium]
MNKKQVGTVSFFILSVLGSLYLIGEAALQAFGRSICVSQGCELVGRITRLGDLLTILIGFIALSLLALLSGLTLRWQNGDLDSAINPGWLDLAINLALIAALAAEGFFFGYQIFWLPELCLFCLSVMGIFLTLGLLRLFSDWKAAVTGFATFAVVLLFVGLLLPPPGPALPGSKMILFYSEDCRHCTEIKREIDKNKLNIRPVLVKDYTATLRNLGVDRVPTLFVNAHHQKLILIGKEAILRYLAACQSSEKPMPSGSVPHNLKKRIPAESGISDSVLPHPPLGTPNPIFQPSTDEGACKEDQKCD